MLYHNINEFEFYYNKWKNACKDELIKKGYSESDIKHCDICEDGSIYFGNLSLTSANFVTSWEDSEFYCK